MGESRVSVSPPDFVRRIGTAAAPLVVDVPRVGVFEKDLRAVVAAVRRIPGEVGCWWPALDYPSRGVDCRGETHNWIPEVRA